MLTALRQNGKYLCLIDGWSRGELEEMKRRGESFRCPACKQPVHLKLGYNKSFHFAHQTTSNCLEGLEKESEYHIQGKRDLYDWLKKEGIYVKLEPFLKEIQQRPDLLVIYRSQSYVIEFQCSVIPPEHVAKRTSVYRKAGYIPIWILGASILKQLSIRTIELTAFQWMFLEQYENEPFTTRILFYSPDSRTLIQATNVVPFSVKKAITTIIQTPLCNLSFQHFLQHPKKILINPLQIKSYKQHARIYITRHPSPQRKLLLQELYRLGIQPAFYPSFVGIPVYSGFWFHTSLLDWQLWLFIDLLSKLNIGDTFTLQQAFQIIRKRKNRRQVTVRQLPLVTSGDFSMAIKEYVLVLERLGLVTCIDINTFQLVNNYEIPTTMNKAFQADKQTLKKISEWEIMNRNPHKEGK